MMAAVTSALTSIMGWVGSVVSSLTGTDTDLAPLLPLLAIGIACSAFMFAMRAIRKVCWGA